MRTFTAGPRKGLSMSELLIGMVVLAIVGLALTKTLTSQAMYFDHQKTGNLARAVARGPINRIVSDLRMVEARGGMISASPAQIEVRVPYAIGVVCGSGNNYTHISLLPVGSARTKALTWAFWSSTPLRSAFTRVKPAAIEIESMPTTRIAEGSANPFR